MSDQIDSGRTDHIKFIFIQLRLFMFRFREMGGTYPIVILRFPTVFISVFSRPVRRVIYHTNCKLQFGAEFCGISFSFIVKCRKTKLEALCKIICSVDSYIHLPREKLRLYRNFKTIFTNNDIL